MSPQYWGNLQQATITAHRPVETQSLTYPRTNQKHLLRCPGGKAIRNCDSISFIVNLFLVALS